MKKNKKSFEEIKSNIFRHFDFEKIHTAMVSVNWEWSTHNAENKEEAEVPSIERIKERCLDLLKKCYEEECTIGTGGFMAHWDGKSIMLTFVFEEWHTSIYNDLG